MKPIGFVAVALIGLGALFLFKKKGRKPPCGNYGDIDGDGFITAADAELVGQYYVKAIDLTAEQLSRADVNGDGKVTMVDAQIIGRYAAGEIDTFPVCLTQPEIPPTDWEYSSETGSIIGRILTLGVQITNNTNVVITRNVDFWWKILPDGSDNLAYGKDVTLAGGESSWFNFDLELWATPPSGTIIEMWLTDSEGGSSSRVRAIA